MIVTRGTRAVALVVGSMLALAACGSSGSDNASGSGDTATAPSFEVRPVVKERPANKDGDCSVTQVIGALADAPIEGACSSDKSTVYDLGPAAVTVGNVATVSAVGNDGGGTALVAVDLDDAGTESFATLTSRANAQRAPLNKVAVVVNDSVVTATSVEQGPITGGQLEISFHDAAAAKAFVASWPEGKRSTYTPGAQAADKPAVQLSTRCQDLLDELYSRTYPLVSRTITMRSGSAESKVIRDVFPSAGEDDEFFVCTTPPTAVTPSPGAATCAPGLTAYKAEPTWLIDDKGTAVEISRANREALLRGSGMACF